MCFSVCVCVCVSVCVYVYVCFSACVNMFSCHMCLRCAHRFCEWWRGMVERGLGEGFWSAYSLLRPFDNPAAGPGPPCRCKAEQWCGLPGCSGVSGRFHEHCDGADRGVREWAAEEQVWGCFYSWEQRTVHFDDPTPRWSAMMNGCCIVY